MHTFKIAFVVMLALVFVSGGKPAGKKAVENSGETSFTDRTASQPYSASFDVPFEVYPFKETFVTAEGDPFLVELSVDCPPDATNDSEFKLLDHPPRFVSLSAPLRGEDRAVVLLVVNPQRGDAGIYEFRVSSKVCAGNIGGITPFRIKVKKAK